MKMACGAVISSFRHTMGCVKYWDYTGRYADDLMPKDNPRGIEAAASIAVAAGVGHKRICIGRHKR